jgi:DNA repair protein RadD
MFESEIGRCEALVAKRIRPSELGCFEAGTVIGPETSQHTLELDRDIVEKVFAPDDNLVQIDLEERCWRDSHFTVSQRPMKRQQNEWRIAIPTVKGERLGRIRSDDIILMLFERKDRGAPWHLTWEVIHQADAATSVLFEMVRAALRDQSAVVVPADQHPRLLGSMRRRLRNFGGDPHIDTGELSDDDWEQVITWLHEHLTVQRMRAMLGDEHGQSVRRVVQALGARSRGHGGNEAQNLLRRFGSDLLADADRRTVLIRARFPSESGRPLNPERWHRGGPAALALVHALGLPSCMAGVPVATPEDFEDVDAFRPLGPLHPYQETIARELREVLRATQWEKRRAIAWMPTGTGKTRVTVETVLMECNLEAPRNCVLWIADRDELCEQAVETFRHVWMVRGRDARTARSGLVPPMRIVRLWGHRPWQEAPRHPTVIVASIQTLATRLQNGENPAFAEELAILGERCAVVIFDEAHHVVAKTYGQVIRALGMDRQENYLGRNQRTSPPLIGLTATPARRHDDETAQLSRRFGGILVEPEEPFRELRGYQEAGYLSRAQHIAVHTEYSVRFTPGEERQYAVFQSLPPSLLRRMGEEHGRTQLIVADLEKRLDQFQSVLVFACSVEHARVLSEVLLRRGHRAASLDGTTDRPVRWRTIQRFRERQIKILVNCDLLATGFDAPNVDCVVLARPVESPVLYAQMVGRGLRGVRNGGTEICHIIDYQDRVDALPDLETLRASFREMFQKAAD